MKLVFSVGAGNLACGGGKPEIRGQLEELLRHHKLAILDGNYTGRTPAGAVVGHLSLPEIWWRFAVAPDGDWIGWFPKSAIPYVTDGQSAGKPLLLLANDLASTRSIGFEGRFGSQISLSSGAKHLALVSVQTDASCRLIMLKPTTSHLECDLTGLVTQSHLTGVERLRLSSDGNRLAVGSRNSFVIIDVPSRKVLVNTDGRFPAPSPDGTSVAFVNRQRELILLDLETSSRRLLSDKVSVHGVGSWSPDGRLLLAGGRASISYRDTLLAFDRTPNGFLELWKLGEGDAGNEFAWINQRLLSSQPPE